MESFEADNGEVYSKQLNSLTPQSIRLGFIRKVYAILGCQLLVTFIVALPIKMYVTPYSPVYPLLGFCVWVPLIMLIGATCCCMQMLKQFPANVIFLAVFTVFEAISIGMLTIRYQSETVLLAALITAVLVIVLSAYAALTSHDFSGCGPYLFGAMAGMFAFFMCIAIWSMFAPVPSGIHLVYCLLGVMLFSMFLVYDTQMIIGEAPIMGFGGHHREQQYSVDDYVFAALNLYLDIINIFVYILSMLGSKE